MTKRDRADCIIALLNSQLEHLKQTRELEFKVNISLWSAVVIVGGFLFGKIHLYTVHNWLFFILIGFIVLVGHFLFWMLPIQNTEDSDAHFIREYREQLEALAFVTCPSPPKKSPAWLWQILDNLRKDGWSWIIFECSFTLILIICVGIVLAAP